MADGISQTRYDYKIKFQEALNEGKIVPVAVERCPLCIEKHSGLLCEDCVNEGKFCHREKDSGT